MSSSLAEQGVLHSLVRAALKGPTPDHVVISAEGETISGDEAESCTEGLVRS